MMYVLDVTVVGKWGCLLFLYAQHHLAMCPLGFDSIPQVELWSK